VTHDHRTLHYADRIITIEDGRIVGDERPPKKGGPGDGAASKKKNVAA
jgi:putative ABC transport system ATP-binding protein